MGGRAFFLEDLLMGDDQEEGLCSISFHAVEEPLQDTSGNQPLRRTFIETSATKFFPHPFAIFIKVKPFGTDRSFPTLIKPGELGGAWDLTVRENNVISAQLENWFGITPEPGVIPEQVTCVKTKDDEIRMKGPPISFIQKDLLIRAITGDSPVDHLFLRQETIHQDLRKGLLISYLEAKRIGVPDKKDSMLSRLTWDRPISRPSLAMGIGVDPIAAIVRLERPSQVGVKPEHGIPKDEGITLTVSHYPFPFLYQAPVSTGWNHAAYSTDKPPSQFYKQQKKENCNEDKNKRFGATKP